MTRQELGSWTAGVYHEQGEDAASNFFEEYAAEVDEGFDFETERELMDNPWDDAPERY